MDEHIEDCHKNIDAGSSRRSFLKKSAIVTAPIVMTAWSRPVLGATVSLSGILSGNVSGEGGREGDLGRSPGYWMNHEEAYPTDITLETLYHPLFSGNYHIDSVTGVSYTLGDIFEEFRSNGSNGGKWSPGPHLIAAYLNARTYDTYLLSESDVQDIANEYASNPTHDRSSMIRSFLDTTWDS